MARYLHSGTPRALRGTTWRPIAASLLLAGVGLAVALSGVAMAARATAPRPLPRIDATAPASPSGILTPTVVGIAAPRSHVALFAGAGCSGRPLGATNAARNGRFSVRTVELAFGTRTRISALAQGRAGHAPTCSDAVSFVHLGVTVAMHHDAYLPARTVVRAGTVVRWRNDDTDLHASASDSTGEPFATANVGMGRWVEHRFDAVGTFAYHCPEHPGMTGTVVVSA